MSCSLIPKIYSLHDILRRDLTVRGICHGVEHPNSLAQELVSASGANSGVLCRNVPKPQVGDAAVGRVALHAPSDGHVALGSVLSGTLDFRASQEAAALNPEAPRCVQVRYN